MAEKRAAPSWSGQSGGAALAQGSSLKLPPETRCRRCGAPIIWVWTLRQKRAPLDSQPQPDGTVELEQAVDGRWYALKLRDTRAMMRRNMGQELHRFHDCQEG